MKLFTYLFFISSISIFIACGSKEPSTSTIIESKPVSPVDGKIIYTRECVICHGEFGNKRIAGSADLSQSQISLEERVNIISNGKGIMQPFKNKLTPAEIDAVARYTLELAK